MDEIICFDAVEVVVTPQTGFVGFANDDHYVWMQPDEMETAKSSIWLERDDQQCGGTGTDWEVVLARRKFTLLTKSASSWMGCDSIEATFEIDDEKYEELRQVLQKNMSSCLSDLSIVD